MSKTNASNSDPHQYTSQKDTEDVQYAMFLVMVRAGKEFTHITAYES